MQRIVSLASNLRQPQDDKLGRMKKYLLIFIILILLFILIYSANFYFLSRLSSSINITSRSKSFSDAQNRHDLKFPGSLDESNIKEIYKTKNTKLDQIRQKIIKNFLPSGFPKVKNYSDVWEEANTVSNECFVVER